MGFFETTERIHRFFKEYGNEVAVLTTVVLSVGLPLGTYLLSGFFTPTIAFGATEKSLFLTSTVVVLVSLLLVYSYLWRPVRRFRAGRNGKSLSRELLEVEEGSVREILSHGPVAPNAKIEGDLKDDILTQAVVIAISQNIRETARRVEDGVSDSAIALSIWAILAIALAAVFAAIPGVDAAWWVVGLIVLAGGATAWGRLSVTYPYYGVALWRKQINKLLDLSPEEVPGQIRRWALTGPKYPLFSGD